MADPHRISPHQTPSTWFDRSPEALTLERLRQHYLQVRRMQNCSLTTIRLWNYNLGRFLTWCDERGMSLATELTAQHLSAFRRYLFHYRHPKTGKPLQFDTQGKFIYALRSFFLWLQVEGILATNLAEHLEVPREEQRLPANVLTAAQVETVLNGTDITQPLGLRDRAILETFYSTAIRCSEHLRLEVYDLEAERGVRKIRQGKGHKDRVVPIGERALAWLDKYLADVRPSLVARTGTTSLFVTHSGRTFGRESLIYLVRQYLLKGGITCRGACHLLRHTAATLMLENGADLRSLQLYLGHARLNTTQIYTHVSIGRLKEVHRKTHPADRHPDENERASESAD